MWVIIPAVFAWLVGCMVTSWAIYRSESYPEPIEMKEVREPSKCEFPHGHSGRYGISHKDYCYETVTRPVGSNKEVMWKAFAFSLLWPLWFPFWFCWLIGHKINGG